MTTKTTKTVTSKTTKKDVPYVVVRDGHRVSEKEYSNKSDAQLEYDFWNSVVTRWPDGTKVDIVKKNNRLHRVYSV